MPADRRALRQALKRMRERRMLVGFDFDCTLTVRHFYKVFAWCYPCGSHSHPHYEAFADWCEERNVEPSLQLQLPRGQQLEMDGILNEFTRKSGADTLKDLLREVFFGGEARIKLVAESLSRMQQAGADFGIVTAGTSTGVLRVLTAVPEWMPFFPSNRIWDTSQGRHSIGSVAGQKVLMLRDIASAQASIMLVDDSLDRDPPAEWAVQAAKVALFSLPYEGPGLQEDSLKQLEEDVQKLDA